MRKSGNPQGPKGPYNRKKRKIIPAILHNGFPGFQFKKWEKKAAETEKGAFNFRQAAHPPRSLRLFLLTSRHVLEKFRE
ncbi:MAG: hypothetical protein COT17_03765 [Elusimicrobia bacterium CG08_land_8_20_14_0_20_51_18]|nr:MAG: hypothetical protein COT17_03765 [Elusimicrobia bacterium CG08_land_8_20_14_0_20_51_18]